ncbi:glycosyltransferase [Limnohabitans sp. 2KL-3]|uniref:glycosyltransferase family 2 protein n=1 Tax=Limnohabitans sp. 2KL-3 TaxID=1100700 RepID=UPI000A6D3229|nr:glycosyltransferase [Limnohabitans sp. 2KL-3]
MNIVSDNKLLPLVSVVMPVFNSEKFLVSSIQSVLNQSYDCLEFLIINDGSTDGSEEIILSFTDPRIRYIRLDINVGLAAACNIAIDMAKGAYIARMDSDDICESNRLSDQLEFLENSDIDICGSAMSIFGETYKGVRSYPVDDVDIRIHLLFGNPIAHPTVMGKTTIFKAHKYNPDNRVVEDYELWLLMALNGVKFGNLQHPLVRYRVHSEQVSSLHSSPQLNETRSKAFCFALTQGDLHSLIPDLYPVVYAERRSISLDEFFNFLLAVSKIIESRNANGDILKIFWVNNFRRIFPMNPITSIKSINLARRLKLDLSFTKYLAAFFQGLLFSDCESRFYRVVEFYIRKRRADR